MITPDQYRQVMANLASGVTVVTTRDSKGQPYGLTVSAFTSVSLDPVLVLVCLDNRLSGLQSFKNSKHFGVSVLSEQQEDISRTFARKDSDRPSSLYFDGKLGIPLIKNSLAVLECEVVNIFEGGDHQIFVGRVEHGEALQQTDQPLLYFRGKYQRVKT